MRLIRPMPGKRVKPTASLADGRPVVIVAGFEVLEVGW